MLDVQAQELVELIWRSLWLVFSFQLSEWLPLRRVSWHVEFSSVFKDVGVLANVFILSGKLAVWGSATISCERMREAWFSLIGSKASSRWYLSIWEASRSSPVLQLLLLTCSEMVEILIIWRRIWCWNPRAMNLLFRNRILQLLCADFLIILSIIRYQGRIQIIIEILILIFPIAIRSVNVFFAVSAQSHISKHLHLLWPLAVVGQLISAASFNFILYQSV